MALIAEIPRQIGIAEWKTIIAELQNERHWLQNYRDKDINCRIGEWKTLIAELQNYRDKDTHCRTEYYRIGEANYRISESKTFTRELTSQRHSLQNCRAEYYRTTESIIAEQESLQKSHYSTKWALQKSHYSIKDTAITALQNKRHLLQNCRIKDTAITALQTATVSATLQQQMCRAGSQARLMKEQEAVAMWGIRVELQSPMG